jgi:uncharacterized phage-like protein YoqJ
MWVAEEAILQHIPFSLYLAFPQQGSRWPKSSQDRLERLKETAKEVIYVTQTPSKGAFIMRDRKMVHDAWELLALWDGRREGGTFQTLQYAETYNMPVTNLFFKDLEY